MEDSKVHQGGMSLVKGQRKGEEFLHAACTARPSPLFDTSPRQEDNCKCYRVCGTFRRIAWHILMVHLTSSARFECWSVVQIELQDCNSIPAVRWPAEDMTLQSHERLIWPIPKKD